MVQINYKSDFKITESSETIVSNVPFIFTYYVTKKKKYVASFDGVSEYVNCERLEDGSIEVLFNNSNLGRGTLRVERKYCITDEDFKDGIFNVVTDEATDVFLHDGKTYDPNVRTTVVPPYIKGDKGDPMTWSTMTDEERTGLVQSVAEAIDPEMVMTENEQIRQSNEQVREANERTRKASELQREKAFQGLKGEMQSAITAGNTAAGNAQKVVDEYDTKVAEQDSKLSQLGQRVGGFWDLTTNLQNGYYSAGGVITPLDNYRCKAFSIPTSLEGTTIIIKAGSPYNAIDYCWMKYKDNTYVPLSNICTIVDGYGVLGIDNSMLELEISFDYRNSVIPFVSKYLAKEFNEKIVPINPTNVVLNTFTLDVTSQYITEENEEIGYYDYKGELHGSDTNWKHVTFNVPAKTYLRFQYYTYPTVGVFIVKYSNGRQKIYANSNSKQFQLQDVILFAEEDCVLTWSYSVMLEQTTHRIYAVEKSKDISELQEVILNKNIQLINVENPDYSGKYWDANGELQTLNSYRAFEVNISSYIGKSIKVRAGYQISTTEIVGWCWIKKYDNSVVALSNYIQEFISGECAIVQIPEDANKLLLSWDKATYNKNGWLDAYCIYEIESEFSKLQDNVETLNNQVESLTEKSLPLDGKKIFLFGDSISSNDYTWYKDYLALYTGAIVYNQGASGRNAAYQASNEYFQRLANLPSDVIVVLVGGNDSGVSGSIGTFDSNSPLGQMGESIVQETDISIDYNGTTFIQAISHIIRKWRSLYWNFRLAAGLNANILDTQNDNEVVYPLSGTATESQCMSYAQSQGWTLGYGERYVMKTTETDADKRAKLIAVKQPKMFLCTTLPQRRYNSSSYWSNPQNWERKRLACIECAKKYGIPLIDLAKEFAIDWDSEPYWPGQGYSGTSQTDNQGIYTMDGLHPNEFGYAYISQIVSKHLIGDISN